MLRTQLNAATAALTGWLRCTDPSRHVANSLTRDRPAFKRLAFAGKCGVWADPTNEPEMCNKSVHWKTRRRKRGRPRAVKRQRAAYIDLSQALQAPTIS